MCSGFAKSAFQNAFSGWRSFRQIRLQPIARKASWDVVAAFVADAQATVLVQPGDRALNDPALFAEPGAVRRLRGGDPRLDATAAELEPSLARVVGAIAVEPFRSAAGTAAAAAQGRDRIHERDHLRDVVAVAAC